MDCPPSASVQPNIQRDSVAIRGRGRTLSESVPSISPESFAKQGYSDNYIDGLSHPRAEEIDDKGAPSESTMGFLKKMFLRLRDFFRREG
ncbi:hypothetical protein C8R47DRAFT_1313265 [Mycena vitilis]|nr:hypothetical protein C8R47DRAFT_1313265 [Mycena vitilis]